jgi:hypothetical protein
MKIFLIGLILLALALLVFGVVESDAAIKYVTLTGSGTACTKEQPCGWQILNNTTAARPQAGDEVIIVGGSPNLPVTFTNVFINQDCNAGVSSGTAGNRITVRAEIPGAVIFRSASSSSFVWRFQNCRFWTWEGIVFRGSATAGTNDPNNTIWWTNSDDNIFRKNILFEHPGKESPFFYEDSDRNLFEDIMILRYGGHGLVNYRGDDNVVRRYYANPRDFAFATDIDGAARGDGGAHYSGSRNIFENSISEGNYQRAGCFSLGQNAYRIAEDNAMYGNICLGSIFMAKGFDIRTSTAAAWTQLRPRFENNLAMATGPAPTTTSFRHAFWLRTVRQAVLLNNTAIGFGASTDVGVGVIKSDIDFFAGQTCGSSRPIVGFTATNNVLIGDTARSDDTATAVDCLAQHEQLSINHIATLASSFGGSPLFSPDAGQVTNKIALGSNPYTTAACVVFPPNDPQLIETGFGKANMGAEILYALTNGVKDTNSPLWNPATKKWIGGSAPFVAGISDTNSIHDIEQRLHPNCNTWPAGYGNAEGPPTLTPNLTTVQPGGLISVAVDDNDIAERVEHVGDWVGMYVVGALATDYIDWFYLNNTKEHPASPISDGNISFAAPSTPCSCEFRFFRSDSVLQVDVLATAGFTVGAKGIVIKLDVSTLKVGPGVTKKVGVP